MCDPVTALAVASGVAGIGGGIINSNAQTANQAAAINAKNAGAQALADQESKLQQQSTGIFQQSMQPYTGAAPVANLAAAQGGNTATIAANAPSAASLAGGATTGDAPKVVQDSENSTIANRIKSFADKDAALGNLTGYDTNNQDNSRTLKGAADQIGTIGNFATQDANVGNALTQAAITNSQKAPSPFGDILQGVGGIGAQVAGAKGAFSNLFSPKLPVTVTPNQYNPGFFG